MLRPPHSHWPARRAATVEADPRIGSSVFDIGLFVPCVGLLPALPSVVCLLAFNLMVARRFCQLARTPPTPLSSQIEQQQAFAT